MTKIPICPACDEPVVDQPFENWTSAYRSGGATWWHLADNRPICPAANGSHSQPVFVEDGLPADSETSTWLATMSDLFAIDGPSNPARLGSAIIAAEHLHRWLHTATGPFSAPLVLRTPSDVAVLVGHLHRTTRLLARVHMQTGSYLLDQARQSRFAGLNDDSDLRDDVIGDANEVEVLLHSAAIWSTDSAKMTGIAWSNTREVAALTTATSTGQTDEHASPVDSPTSRTQTAAYLRNLARRLRLWVFPALDTAREPTSPDVPQEPFDTFALSPEHLAELIGSTFGDEAGFSPQLTHTAERILPNRRQLPVELHRAGQVRRHPHPPGPR